MREEYETRLPCRDSCEDVSQEQLLNSYAAARLLIPLLSDVWRGCFFCLFCFKSLVVSQPHRMKDEAE